MLQQLSNIKRNVDKYILFAYHNFSSLVDFDIHLPFVPKSGHGTKRALKIVVIHYQAIANTNAMIGAVELLQTGSCPRAVA